MFLLPDPFSFPKSFQVLILIGVATFIIKGGGGRALKKIRRRRKKKESIVFVKGGDSLVI